jgi:(p)ppGpp synthase/HD superfamily hydrolase
MLYEAIRVAATAHKDQKRKGTDLPYIMHPLSVAIALSRAGYPEEVIAAGALHDTVEDTGLMLEDIRRVFGDRVADIVEGCSEPDRSLPWEARKQHTLDQLKTAAREVRAVSCADKLDNARSILADKRKLGNRVWDRFSRGQDQQKWYYQGLVAGLCGRLDEEAEGSIFHQFRDVVAELFGADDGPGGS